MLPCRVKSLGLRVHHGPRFSKLATARSLRFTRPLASPSGGSAARRHPARDRFDLRAASHRAWQGTVLRAARGSEETPSAPGTKRPEKDPVFTKQNRIR